MRIILTSQGIVHLGIIYVFIFKKFYFFICAMSGLQHVGS